MTYTIIGTGNMAWFLAERLKAEGYTCKGVYGRDHEKAQQLAMFLQTDIIQNIPSIKDGNDCCIIAVADHAIKEIADQLSLKETTVVHTAGSVAMEIIESDNKAVLWPVYSLVKDQFPKHRHIPVIIEANTITSRKLIYELTMTISDIVQEATWEQRQWLHLTAVVGNNFTNHLMTICEKICEEQGLSFSLLKPILAQTFERTATTLPSAVQTGPAKRKDDITISKHISLLKQHPLWQEVYRHLSASIQDMYDVPGKSQ